MNTDQNSKLQQLLRLKRLETPGEAYFDAFLAEFQSYQVTQSLAPAPAVSSMEALFGRLGSWMESFALRPLMPMASAGLGLALVALVGVISLGGLTSAPSTLSEAAVGGAYSQGYVTAPAVPARLIAQPEEIDLASVSSFDKDFSNARYVTGQAVGEYDSALAF